MANRKFGEVYQCGCDVCASMPRSKEAREHRKINRMVATLDEKNARRVIGMMAEQIGRGGVTKLHIITGLSRNTIMRGQQEPAEPEDSIPADRVRAPGGGAPPTGKKTPELRGVLADVMEGASAGDPTSRVKWSRKSTRLVSLLLSARRTPASHSSVGRRLKRAGDSLRSNRKRLSQRHSPNRDQQFRHIDRLRRRFLRRGLPVISVDAKKRELVGLFKNAGRIWRREPEDVSTYDYPTGASKWNPVEHRLFSAISVNWAGTPLRDYQTICGFIRETRTPSGRRCRVRLDTRYWPTANELKTMTLRGLAAHHASQKPRVRAAHLLEAWNYAVMPAFCAS